MQIPGIDSTDSNSTHLGWGLGICSLTGLPGDAEADQFMDHTADENIYLDSLPRSPGAVLYSSSKMVALVGAKELGHLFLAARVREEGPTTHTLDDVPFGCKSVFNVVTQYAGINIWYNPPFPLPLVPFIPAISSLVR